MTFALWAPVCNAARGDRSCGSPCGAALRSCSQVVKVHSLVKEQVLCVAQFVAGPVCMAHEALVTAQCGSDRRSNNDQNRLSRGPVRDSAGRQQPPSPLAHIPIGVDLKLHEYPIDFGRCQGLVCQPQQPTAHVQRCSTYTEGYSPPARRRENKQSLRPCSDSTMAARRHDCRPRRCSPQRHAGSLPCCPLAGHRGYTSLKRTRLAAFSRVRTCSDDWKPGKPCRHSR